MITIQSNPGFAKGLAEVSEVRRLKQEPQTEKLLEWILSSIQSAAKIGKRRKSYRVYHYKHFEKANILSVKEILVRDFGLICSEEYEKWCKENVLIVEW